MEVFKNMKQKTDHGWTDQQKRVITKDSVGKAQGPKRECKLHLPSAYLFGICPMRTHLKPLFAGWQVASFYNGKGSFRISKQHIKDFLRKGKKAKIA